MKMKLTESEYLQVEPRRLVKSRKFTQLAPGSSFTLAICDQGYLYGCGEGFLDKKSKSKEFHVLPVKERVKFVAAGKQHMAVVDVHGQVHTWGHGGSFFKGGGQLGHNSREDESQPRMIEWFKAYGAKAKKVGCGAHHTVILTEDGEVLTCGIGEFGRLGTGHTSDSMVPAPVEGLAEENVVDIAVGPTHTLALTEEGRVYSWGRNDMGQLGMPDSNMDIYSMEAFPMPIPALSKHAVKKASEKPQDNNRNSSNNISKIVSIAAGKGRSAAVTEDGQFYLWGVKLHHEPHILENSNFGGQKIKKVACGGESNAAVTAVLTEDGELWTFGDTSSKCLARVGVSGKMMTPEVVPQFLQNHMEVVDIYTGPGRHMAAKVVLPESN